MAEATTSLTSNDSSTPDSPAPDKAPSVGGGFGGDLSSLAQRLEQSSSDTLKKLDETRPAKMALLEKLSSEKMPVPPEIAPPEKPTPGPAETEPLQKFGSVASALAIFGSLLSRRPLQNALNSSAAAMNAIKANDAEAYKKHLDEWKQQSEYAGKVAEWQAQRYRAAMEQYKGNHDQLMSQLSVIAALDNDTTVQHSIRTGDLSLVEKVLDDRYRMVKDYQTHQLDADRLGETKRHDLEMEKSPEKDAYFAARKLNPDKPPTEILREMHEATTEGKQWQVVVDPKTRVPYRYNAVTGDATHLDRAPFAPGERPEGLEKISNNPRSAPAMYLKTFLEGNPDATPQQIAKAMATYRAQGAAEVGFGPTGQVGKNIVAINTAINHLDSWEKLATKAATGDVQAFNSLWNSLRTEVLGDPQGTNAQIAAQFVGPEIVKSIVATGGGVEERDQLKRLLSTRLSAAQVQGSADTAREFLAGRMAPIKQQYEKTVGGDDFEETYLSPRAREVFTTIKPGGGSAESAKELSEDEYNAAPSGTHYRVPGNPRTMTKP